MLTHILSGILASSQRANETVYALPLLDLFQHLEIISGHFIWMELGSLHETVRRLSPTKLLVHFCGKVSPLCILFLILSENVLLSVDHSSRQAGDFGQLWLLLSRVSERSLKRVKNLVWILRPVSYPLYVGVKLVIRHAILLSLASCHARTFSRGRRSVWIVLEAKWIQ